MPRPRLMFSSWPAAIYAIGDVHGCLAQLLALEKEIVADAATFPGEKWLLTLGDHIDRGPDSAGVVEHVLSPPPHGFRRFALLGNHEHMLLEFLGDPAQHAWWLDEGGFETLRSYGVMLVGNRDVDHGFALAALEKIPGSHLDFYRALPTMLALPGWAFVHAGIAPGVPLAAQDDHDLIWIRRPFLDSEGPHESRIVHGHTPGRAPVVTPARIGIDTHCFQRGTLTALRVTPDGETKFLQVSL